MSNSMSKNLNNEYFVHFRPLPKKVGGMYQNIPWSDVMLQNVPKETTYALAENDDNMKDKIRHFKEILEDEESTYINKRTSDKNINISTSEIREDDIKKFIKGYKQRPIPKRKRSTYETKPRKHNVSQKNTCAM